MPRWWAPTGGPSCPLPGPRTSPRGCTARQQEAGDTLTEGPWRNLGGPVRGGLFTVYVVPIKQDPVTPGAALSVHPLRKTAT